MIRLMAVAGLLALRVLSATAPGNWRPSITTGRQFWLYTMITCALIASAVIALVLVVLVQGKWTSRDSWFAAVFASAVMAMVIDHYVNHIN